MGCALVVLSAAVALAILLVLGMYYVPGFMVALVVVGAVAGLTYLIHEAAE